MNRWRLINLCLWAVYLIYLSAPIYAQTEQHEGPTKPNFSGAWMRESVKRDAVQNSLDMPAGTETEVRLVVKHSDPELAFRRIVVRDGREYMEDQVFYTDRRGETHKSEEMKSSGAGSTSDTSMKSKTKWDGKKIRIESKTTIHSQIGVTYLRMTQEWSLSEDGKTLTIKRLVMPQEGAGGEALGAIFGPQSPRGTKEVFRRVSR